MVVRPVKTPRDQSHGVQSTEEYPLKVGNKSDRIDAKKLAELLRNGSLSDGLPWGERRTNIEGTGAQLSDDQQRSRASHESAQGPVSELGHSLCWHASLCTAPPFGMVEQDHGSRRAPSSRALLPTTRRAAALRQEVRQDLLAEAGNITRRNCYARFLVSVRFGRRNWSR